MRTVDTAEEFLQLLYTSDASAMWDCYIQANRIVYSKITAARFLYYADELHFWVDAGNSREYEAFNDFCKKAGLPFCVTEDGVQTPLGTINPWVGSFGNRYPTLAQLLDPINYV